MGGPTQDEAYQADVQASLYGEKGGKGGGGGGGETRTPQEAPNTLQSNSKARILDLLGEGPIEGLVDGYKSIFLDDTPLQNHDGTFNFDGVTVHTRDGYSDQRYIPGFPSVETERQVDADVLHGNPIVRSIENLDVDAARVKISIPSLTKQDLENGDLLEYEVQIAIDVRYAGGSWAERVRDVISGKTTSPYQRQYRVPLGGQGPWEIRVRRVTADSEKAHLKNETRWVSFTEIIDAKLTYPDSALVGLEVNARQFGTNIPSRAYDVRGKIIRVPSNYNPSTRHYSGLWDGTFKMAWTDNPAWCFYDLLIDTRYGAGLENVDKWELYQIGRYCDEMVPDGFGGEEPRFTFNTVVTDRKDAYVAIQELASAFRGITYWGANQVMPVADMPRDPVKLVSPANVKDGAFEYSGTSLKNRHSVALVTWNDPDNAYEPTVEVVEDPDSVQRFGWKKTETTAVACTSRGQAHRLGKWILDSEKHETETVTYTAALDHADLRPGDIIQVNDPHYAAARMGGRQRPVSLTELDLDAVPEDLEDATWYIDVVMPNLSLERRQVLRFDGNRAILDGPLSERPVDNGMWMLSSQSLEPRLFRVMSVEETEALEYTITALEYDPAKFARVEQGLRMPPPEYTNLPTGPVPAPSGVTVETYTYLAGGTQHQGLSISWTEAEDPRVNRYLVEVQGPNDIKWRQAYLGSGVSTDLYDIAWGEWQVRVRALTSAGRPSPWAMRTTSVAGLLVPVKPDSVDVQAYTFSVTLIPEGTQPNAQWEFWRATVALFEDQILDNAIRAGVGSSLVDQDLQPDTQYYYWIRGVNPYGYSGWYPVQAKTDNNPANILRVLSNEIRESHLHGELRENVDKIPELERNAEDTQELIKLRNDILLVKQDAMGAAVQTERVSRVDENEALAQRVDTVQAVLDNDFAAVQQTAKALIDRTGELGAEYTLKLDVNGYVSGFGAYNDGTTSDFAVRADRFSIAAPGTGQGEIVPFVVEDDRVYMDEALINTITFNKLTDPTGGFVAEGGKLRAEYIDVDNLDVQEAARFTGDVFSNNYEPGKTGWAILQSGYVEFNEAMIRGNLEIQSLSVNGEVPSEPVRVTGSNYSRRGPTGYNSWDYTRTYSSQINEMPAGARLSATLYPRLRWTHYSNLRNKYGITARAWGRVRVLVDGRTVYDRTHTFANERRHGSGHGNEFGGSFANYNSGVHITFTYPEYRAVSTVQVICRMWGNIGSDGDHQNTNQHVIGEDILVGEANRLG